MNEEEPRKKQRYRFSTDDDKCARIFEGYPNGRFLTAEDQAEPLEIRQWKKGNPITTDGCVGHRIIEEAHTVEELLTMLRESHAVVVACTKRLREAEDRELEYRERLVEKGIVITPEFYSS